MLRKELKQRKEDTLKREIQEKGGDLVVETMRRQRIEQFQKKMAEFQKKQDKKKMEIVEKLLKEEESIKQKNDLQMESLERESMRKRHRRRNRKRKKEEKPKNRSGSAPSEISESKKSSNEIEETLEDKILDGRDIGERADEQLSTLDTYHLTVQPEIQGIWDEETATQAGEAERATGIILPKNHSSKDMSEGRENSTVKKRIFSTTERRMMQATLEKLRKGIVRKQVAAGREFKVS